MKIELATCHVSCMNPPPNLEDDYLAEFNARRKYAPESVISFTDFGLPAISESDVRKLIHSGKVILTKFENVKLCAMGNLIRKIQSYVTNGTQVLNIVRTVLTLKDCDVDEFMGRLDKMKRLVDNILEEQASEAVTDEPRVLEEPKAPTNEPKKPKASTKEPAPQVGGAEVKAKKQSIPKKVKDDVWNTYIGEGIAKHKCLCCKLTLIDKAKFDCGHVISEKNGGTLSIRNLRPVCNGCNLSMKTDNMIDYVKKHEYYIG